MAETSVIIPAYNREETISRAIRSVRKQTYQDFQIIVVDDCSDDGTRQRVREMDVDRLTLIQHEQNKGANAARNTGIEAANGDFICFLDSDDELDEQYLQTVVTTFQEHSTDCGGVTTGYNRSTDGEITDTSSPATGKITLDVAVGKDDRFRSRKNVIGGFSCTTFRAGIFEDVGLLDESLPSLQDLDFYLRVLEQYYIYGIAEPLVTYYRDGDQISTNVEAKKRGKERFLEKHGDKFDSKLMANFHYTMGFVYAEHDEMNKASAEFRRAIGVYPQNPLYYYHYLTAKLGKSVFDTALRIKLSIKNKVTAIT